MDDILERIGLVEAKLKNVRGDNTIMRSAFSSLIERLEDLEIRVKAKRKERKAHPPAPPQQPQPQLPSPLSTKKMQKKVETPSSSYKSHHRREHRSPGYSSNATTPSRRYSKDQRKTPKHRQMLPMVGGSRSFSSASKHTPSYSRIKSSPHGSYSNSKTPRSKGSHFNRSFQSIDKRQHGASSEEYDPDADAMLTPTERHLQNKLTTPLTTNSKKRHRKTNERLTKSSSKIRTMRGGKISPLKRDNYETGFLAGRLTKQTYYYIGRKKIFYDPPSTVDHAAKARAVRDPECVLQLDHIHGYNGSVLRDNLFYVRAGGVDDMLMSMNMDLDTLDMGSGSSASRSERYNMIYSVAGAVIVQDSTSLRQRHYLNHTSAIASLTIHPDDPLVASGQVEVEDSNPSASPSSALQLGNGQSAFVSIWNYESMEEVTRIYHLPHSITGVEFTPDGDQIGRAHV